MQSSKTQHHFQKKKVCGKSGASLGGFPIKRIGSHRIPLIYAECECLYSVSTSHAPLHPLSVCLLNILADSIMLLATNKTAVLKGVAPPIYCKSLKLFPRKRLQFSHEPVGVTF